MRNSQAIWHFSTTLTLIAVTAFLLLATTGCVILPIPNSRVEGSGLKSRLVDADTGRPIAGARVSASPGNRMATTGADGRFELPPHVQRHFGYLAGVLSYPIWPFTGDAILAQCEVRIEAAGYPTTTYIIPDPDDDTIKPDAEKDGILYVPRLMLHAQAGPSKP